MGAIDLRVTVDTERELRQVVRADGEAIEDLGEGFGRDHVAGPRESRAGASA
jgi:hypothetical protein